jgi:hypothetical protein
VGSGLSANFLSGSRGIAEFSAESVTQKHNSGIPSSFRVRPWPDLLRSAENTEEVEWVDILHLNWNQRFLIVPVAAGYPCHEKALIPSGVNRD